MKFAESLALLDLSVAAGKAAVHLGAQFGFQRRDKPRQRGSGRRFQALLIEHALAHKLKDKSEAAYARGDLLAKRKLLMTAWAQHCDNSNRATVALITRRNQG